jgi:von Willebrand factor type A domain
VTETTCPPAADVVLILDESSSINFWDPTAFTKILNFAKSIVGAFPISSSLTQIGLMKFSDSAQPVFYLNSYADQQSLLDAIGRVQYNEGQTNFVAALRTARQVMFSPSNGARSGVRKIGFFVTDGGDKLNRVALIEVNLTRQAGIELFAVGVGNADKGELRALVSEPVGEHYFHVSEYTALNTVVPSFVNNLCHQLTTPTTSQSPTTSTTETATRASVNATGPMISRTTIITSTPSAVTTTEGIVAVMAY